MARIFMIICAMSAFVMANAEAFSYRFNSTPLPKAIQRIMEDHLDLDINFIYNELENYNTSATVHADNAYDALRQTIGLNPVTVVKARDTYYVEAFQHGKYIYTGQAIGSDNDPVVAATVMLLAPNDSTVLTYGIADAEGRFRIPCDRTNVIAKLSCIGYKTTYHQCTTFNIGTIIMPENAVELGAVTVEGENAQLYADRSVYIPTARQKSASQTGADLLAHMAIPQIDAMSSGSIKTNTGKSIKIFIDYVPATENDLQAMRTGDVKRVEYYEYPTEPRLQGHQYVINFIMQQYEYGGYAKAFGNANLISFSEQLLGNTKLQYKKMTYDIMGYGFNMNNSHYGSELRETFRLPQDAGEEFEFSRTSKTTDSKTSNQQYFAAFRATYNSEKIQAVSEIDGSVNTAPHSDRNGVVAYDQESLPESSYASTLRKDAKFVSYSGYYFFSLPENNTITFTPSYIFSHSENHSTYTERGFTEIYNRAKDNTSQIKAKLKYSHDFGEYGNILAYADAVHEYNRTRYYGSAYSLDKIKSSRMGLGLAYSLSIGNIYGQVGIGYDWDRLEFGTSIEKPARPSFDVSLQYAIDKKHSVSIDFDYGTKQPLPSFKSTNVITSSPFLKYTGNPGLVPLKSYEFSADYTWIPNNNLNFSVFASGWIVGDRYAFRYEAMPDGILRTIVQPAGSFAQGRYGAKGTIRILDRKLVFTAMVAQILNHNGSPYDVDHSDIYGYAQARYYLGNWNFALAYISAAGSPDGSVNGIWNKNKSDWYVAIGWSKSNWNIQANVINFTRWNWRSSQQYMESEHYDTNEQFFNGHSHALVQLSATYIFGFGKKIKHDSEPSVKNSTFSGILE